MDWLVLLPPVVAIILALWTRQVFLSLMIGLWFGTTLLMDGNPVLGIRELFDQLVAVFADPGNTRIIFFCLLVGGLIALVQASGGVSGFIDLARKKGWGTTRRGAEVLAVCIGLVIFVESSITSLIVGAVNRPLFDRLLLPREKLAYYCDATSAAVCMMLPLNGWGAFVLGLLAAQGVESGAVGLLASGLLFNFYAVLTIGLAILLAVTGWSFGPMRQAEKRALEKGLLLRPDAVPLMADDVSGIEPEPGSPERARDFFIPIAAMIALIFGGLWITGGGNLMNGSGSTSVLWAVSGAILVAMAMYAVPRRSTGGRALVSLSRSTDLVLKGSAGLVPVTILVVMAFALGQISRELEMGPYLVRLISSTGSGWWIPAVVFVVGSIVAFTLGSSWTAFAVMVPVALPLADGLGLAPGLVLGAILSGGVFGDHASPLSDTSLISSMAAACDHVDHINTQLPYAGVAAGASFVLFLVSGILS